ncbi:serine hydrolase domain-containing protein [Streptodolium elevatio]
MTATPHPPPPVLLTTGPLREAAAELVGPRLGGLPPPGALVAVAAQGAVAYAAVGHSRVHRAGSRTATPATPNATEAEPMQWATRTDAGSVTKVLGTTAALMTLTDLGHLNLDDPAHRYVPGPDPDIRLRDLLEHRAGLREWWPLYLDGSGETDAVTRAARIPRRYPVGAGRHYSDLGFILLGGVLARIGGGLEHTVAELVLRPYGLTGTAYRAPVPGGPVAASSAGDRVERAMVATGTPYPVPAEVAAAADAFPGWRDHVLVGEVNDGNAFHAFGGAAGHAGMFTTAADLLRFAGALDDSLHGRGPIRPVTAEAFATPGADPGQALGLRVWHGPWGRALGHTGFPGVAVAALPDRGAAVAMITNRLHAVGGGAGGAGGESGGAETPPASLGDLRPTEEMWLRVLAAAADHLNA